MMTSALYPFFFDIHPEYLVFNASLFNNKIPRFG